MKVAIRISQLLVLAVITLSSFPVSTVAQTVSIPDPALEAAIREALQQPNGPLTEQDLLGLTQLAAGFRNITNLQGLEAAHNLVGLDLQSNRLTNSAFPNGLTNLNSLSLRDNRLASLDLPTNMTGLDFLDLSENPLTQLTLPGGLVNLTTLLAEFGGLTNLTLSAGMTNLSELHLGANQLTHLALPADMTNLNVLSLFFNQLTNLALPANLKILGHLDVEGNELASLELPTGLTRLGFLAAGGNHLTRFTVPADMTNLNFLRLQDNQLTNLTLPGGLNHLSFLFLSGNQLRSLVLPAGMTNLTGLFLQSNQLTNLVLPSDLNRLVQIDLTGNALPRLTLPAGLTNLVVLAFGGNQLTNLTLPPDLMKLATLLLDGNPLTSFVLSEPLAATNLAGVVATLRTQGVQVFTYPLAIQLVETLTLIGAFKFGITGPPGIYTVLESGNLAAWSVLGAVTNPLGSINFVDGTANVSPRKFYRALLQTPPTNMVFIPANTFTMGSPANELHRDTNEGPQTTVTLGHGFWIGKYEVTQGEYLDVTGTNPSFFPGDLSRPVSSVSWPDATNYCWLLTQRELAAGRISPGSQYRLPTEAEWEFAARAGTTTRFSYGDDPDYSSLTNHAWFISNAGFTVHPVGRMLPNPWGLYDIEGNVWEWCQDWLGPLPGGAVVDPQGPPTNPIGWKVVRGGGYDFGESDCRSARRFFFPNHPALNDTNLGLRVVLVTGP